jgi:hypothetical protein
VKHNIRGKIIFLAGGRKLRMGKMSAGHFRLSIIILVIVLARLRIKSIVVFILTVEPLSLKKTIIAVLAKKSRVGPVLIRVF